VVAAASPASLTLPAPPLPPAWAALCEQCKRVLASVQATVASTLGCGEAADAGLRRSSPLPALLVALLPGG